MDSLDHKIFEEVRAFTLDRLSNPPTFVEFFNPMRSAEYFYTVGVLGFATFFHVAMQANDRLMALGTPSAGGRLPTACG